MAHKNHRGPVHGGGEGSEQKDLKTSHQGLRIKVKHVQDSLSNVERAYVWWSGQREGKWRAVDVGREAIYCVTALR